MQEPLNAIESTLAMILVTQAQARTDALRDAAGYGTPTPEQREDMQRRQLDAVRHLIAGMRAPGAPVPALAELDELVEGLAQGALLAVLGVPPDIAAEQLAN
jgi:hypothetical protein